MSDQPPAPAAPGPQANPVPGQPVTASATPGPAPGTPGSQAGMPAASSALPALPEGPRPSGAAIVEERPEVAAGAAFAAGFVCAMILRRLAR